MSLEYEPSSKPLHSSAYQPNIKHQVMYVVSLFTFNVGAFLQRDVTDLHAYVYAGSITTRPVYMCGYAFVTSSTVSEPGVI